MRRCFLASVCKNTGCLEFELLGVWKTSMKVVLRFSCWSEELPLPKRATRMGEGEVHIGREPQLVSSVKKREEEVFKVEDIGPNQDGWYLEASERDLDVSSGLHGLRHWHTRGESVKDVNVNGSMGTLQGLNSLPRAADRERKGNQERVRPGQILASTSEGELAKE